MGSKYESDDASSWQDAKLYATYDTSNNRLEGLAYDYAGYGTFEAWSYVAKSFSVGGSGSQQATFTVNPHVTAGLSYQGGCSNAASVKLIIKDVTGGEQYDETVFSKAGVIESYDKDITDSHQVSLTAGNTYDVILKQTVQTTCSNTGGSTSDLTDNDDGNHHVNTRKVQVTF